MDDISIKIGLAGVQAYQDGMRQIESSTDQSIGRVGKTVDGVSKSFGELARDLPIIGDALKFISNPIGALVTGLTGAGAAISSFVDSAAEFETVSIQFETLIGDAELAKSTLEGLTQFAATTPFRLDSVTDAGRKLLAFGTDAQDLESTLRRLGDISAGVGAPIEDLADLYGKLNIQQTIYSEDLNQLTSRGIPVLQELAKQFGVAEAEVKKLASTGQISFANIEEAFRSLTDEGGQFQGLTENLSQSFEGLRSTLGDSVQALARDIGELLLPAAKSAVEVAIDLVNGLGNLPEILAANAEFIGIAAGALIAWNSTSILAAAQSVPALIKSVIASTNAFGLQTLATRGAAIATAAYSTVQGVLSGQIKLATIAMRAFNLVAKANPIFLLGSAIAAVAAGFALFGDEAEKVSGTTTKLNNTNKELVDSISKEVTGLQSLFGPLRNENASRDEKKRAIDAINRQYGGLLSNMLTEKSSAEDIARAYQEVTKAIVLKQVAQEQEQKINQLVSSAIQFEKDREAQQRRVNEQRQLGLDLAEEEGAVFGSNAYILQTLAAGQQETLDNTQEFLEQNVNQIENYYSRLSEQLVGVFSNIDLSFITGQFSTVDSAAGTTEEKVKSLSQQLSELGISLSALNQFDELTGLANAIPLASITDSAERAKAEIISIALEPGTPLNQLEEQLSNIKKALELIDPQSAGFEFLAEQAGILEARVNRLNAELDRLSDGGPRQPIVFPVKLSEDNILNQVETLDPPPITVPVDVVVPNQGAFSSLAEAAQALGVDIEYLNNNFRNTGELIELMDSKAFNFFEQFTRDTETAIEYTFLLREALTAIAENTLQGLGSSVEAFGYALGQAIANPIETVDVMQAKLDAVKRALETAPEGSGLQASLQQQAEALEQQLGGVQALRDELGAVNAAMRNLPSDSPAFRALEGQAESLENQLSLLEGTTNRFAGAFDVFVQELLNTVLVAVPKMLGLFLLQSSIPLGFPAGVPFAIAGLALLGASALAKGLLEKAQAQDPSLDLGTFDPGSVSSNLTGGFSGPSLATGQADPQTAVGLSDYANTAQAATNVNIYMDSENITDAFSLAILRDNELRGR